MSEENFSDLITQGDQCFEQGDFHSAISYYDQAAVLAQTRGESSNELKAVSWSVVSLMNIPDLQRGTERANYLLARARQLNSRSYQIDATMRLAAITANTDLRGHWQEIEPLLLENLATAKLLNDD